MIGERKRDFRRLWILLQNRLVENWKFLHFITKRWLYSRVVVLSKDRRTKISEATCPAAYPIQWRHKRSQCWDSRQRFSWFCHGFVDHEEEASKTQPTRRNKLQRPRSHTESSKCMETQENKVLAVKYIVFIRERFLLSKRLWKFSQL